MVLRERRKKNFFMVKLTERNFFFRRPLGRNFFFGDPPNVIFFFISHHALPDDKWSTPYVCTIQPCLCQITDSHNKVLQFANPFPRNTIYMENFADPPSPIFYFLLILPSYVISHRPPCFAMQHS